MESSPPPAPRRRERRQPRPERQQIMLRRGLALGAGLIVLILVVLGVKGCLDARAHRALSDYSRNVTQIVDETSTISKDFFGKLEDPGTLTVTEFVSQVESDRSAMENFSSRVDGLSAPGGMGKPQSSLELVYELRSSAMTEIANKVNTALGDAGSPKATTAIANQMQKLLAADVVYETVVGPEIDAVLAANGISGSDVPKSTFLAGGTKWLDEAAVGSALGSVSGSNGGGATPGPHGLGLVTVSINGTELVEGAPVTVSSEETPEVEVEVQNQGGSTENGISVSVTVDGANTLGTIETLAPQESSSAVIPLTPAPKGEVTLEVKVEPVPGEQLTENNEASYSVTFE